MNITCWYHDILNLNIYTLILFWIFEKKSCSQNQIIFWLIMKWQPSSLVFFYHNFFQSVLKWSRIITKCYLFCNYFGTCDLWSYNVQFKGRILAHMRIVQEIKKNKRSTCIKFHIICLSLLRTISCIRKYRRLSNTNIRVL